MVEYNYSYQETDGALHQILSLILMSCAVVVSLFFGIKWRLFGYRMKIPSIEEEPVTLRTRSATEVRENCSTGRYSHLEDNSIPNYMPSTTSSSSFNVKSKNKERESIFKWPFKSKISLNLKKNHSFNESTYQRPVTPERRDRDIGAMEKNERLKRSIHETLNSSASMPDLLRHDEFSGKDKVNEKMPEIKILKGILVNESTDFVTVDEIKPKRPVRVKTRRAPSPPKQAPEKTVERSESKEEVEPVHSPKPPTPPMRRQSRSNSLRAEQIDIPAHVPPVVMPRRQKNHRYVRIESVDESEPLVIKKLLLEHQTIAENTVIEEDIIEDVVIEQPIIEQPKSILKTSDEGHEHTATAEVHHVKFDVPSSSSSEDEDEEEENVWTQIDIHRNQLKKIQDMESVSRFDEESSCESEQEELPPLPKTPPPLDAMEPPYLRDFSFA